MEDKPDVHSGGESDFVDVQPPQSSIEGTVCHPPVRQSICLPFDAKDLTRIRADHTTFLVSGDILRLCSVFSTPFADSIVISGLSDYNLECFFTVVNAKVISNDLALTLDQWTSALHAATHLGCAFIKDFIVASMGNLAEAQDSASLAELGLRYQVVRWAYEGFEHLIKRRVSISSEEGYILGMERVLAICRCREILARKPRMNIAQVMKEEPALDDPAFNELAKIRVQAGADILERSRHPIHYRSDLVNLLVEDETWTVSVDLLGPSKYFSERISTPSGHKTDETANFDVSGEISKTELSAYLSLLNARKILAGTPQSHRFESFQEWVDALHVATIFGHAAARRYVINYLDPMLSDQDPFNVIDAAKKCAVNHWLKPQYARVAARRSFLTEEEGRRLGVSSLLEICRLREESAYTRGHQASAALLTTPKPAEASVAGRVAEGHQKGDRAGILESENALEIEYEVDAKALDRWRRRSGKMPWHQ